jgi:glutaredoxin
MKDKIMVYGKAGCSRCDMVKNILNNKNITYEYFDLETLPTDKQEAIKDLAKKSNEIMVLPIILKNGISMFVSELK